MVIHLLFLFSITPVTENSDNPVCRKKPAFSPACQQKQSFKCHGFYILLSLENRPLRHYPNG